MHPSGQSQRESGGARRIISNDRVCNGPARHHAHATRALSHTHIHTYVHAHTHRNVVLMLKDLPSGVNFYQKGLGLRLARSSEVMAEFDTGGAFSTRD